MVDYNALRKKFPTKDPGKRKRAAAIRAIAREYELKRAALGGPPVFRKGVVFYAVVIMGLAILGSLVLSVCGKGGRSRVSRAEIQAKKSVAAVAVALGRYRYHVGKYPSTEEGLAALSEITPGKKGWNGPYVNHVVDDPWGHPYVYACNADDECPTLYSKGADGLAGTTDDVLPDRALYDEPFRDTSWTKGWMPYYLRGYVLANDERQRASIQEQVDSVLEAERPPAEGEFLLRDGWEFSRDKAEWRSVRVPHDWSVDPRAGEGRGVGWYRRPLELPRSSAGKFVALRFGGVMSNPQVFLNGERLDGPGGGSAPFQVDVSAKLRFGERNELLVMADASAPHGRWHSGAGLCRDVRLVVEDYEDRVLWGSVRISASDITPERAKVQVVYKTPVSASEIVNEFEVERPVLWDVANPRLYETRICGRTYRYGIRTAGFGADGVFRLNGRPLRLRGVRLRPDLGPLGAAFDAEAMRRRLETMKDMGVNALAVDGAEPPQELLELCDELGILVCGDSRGDGVHPCVAGLPAEGCDFGQFGFDAVVDTEPGEAGPRCTSDGACDLCAMPKDRFWQCRSLWNDRSETVHLATHWSLGGSEGEKVHVVCYTSGDSAELFVNGESAGRRDNRDGVSWDVPYEPGEISVVAFRNGHPIGEDSRRTAFKPAAVRLTPDRTELSDGELAFVKVEIEDEDGTVLPLAEDRVEFSIDGPGEIVAVGNGSPSSPGSFAGNSTLELYRGRALAIVRRTGGSGLPVRLVASARGVRPASAAIPRRGDPLTRERTDF